MAAAATSEETFLSNAEVCILLTSQKAKREANGLRTTEIFDKTLEATRRFAGISEPQKPGMVVHVQELRQQLTVMEFQRESEVDPGSLEMHRLTPFEVAQFSNLMPENPEEAFALMPGLSGRFEHDDIQQVCDICDKIRTNTSLLA